MPGHAKCCTHHAKSSQQTWRSDAPKCNPSQEISALTSWHLWWWYCARHRNRIFADPLHMFHACHRFWKCYKTPFLLTFDKVRNRACHAKRNLNVKKWSAHVVFLTCLLRNVLRATTACTFSTSQLPKVLRTWCGNFEKCSERAVFLAFSLANVLRATTGWTFSTSQLRKALQTWSAFSFFTCIYASRHKRACNFSWPNGSVPRRFSEPTFRPSRATNRWKKHSVSRLSYLFAHLDLISSETFSFLIFFLLPFSSLTLPISAFHLSILSEVWLLNFLRQTFYSFTNLKNDFNPLVDPNNSFVTRYHSTTK